MSDFPDLLTDRQLAAKLGKGFEFVQARCRGEEPDWPHMRVGKSIRFTPDHVDWIIQHVTVGPQPTARAANPWGHTGRSA